jgi:hypothetical protein
MNISVITTLNKKLYKQYGHKFFETYNWPFDLFVYSEDMLDIPHQSLIVRSLFDEVPECEEFVLRNKDKPVEDNANGFLQDAVRFCYKVYAYTDYLMNNEDYDGIICIDADSVFYNPIDIEWIKKHIHRDDTMMSYLGRGKNYSECGFLYFNIKHKDTKSYASRVRSMYDSDEVYELIEKHDSFVWDYVRKEFEKRGTKNHNIGDGRPGHVQARSILGTVYDHIKGPKRKKLLRSPELKI